MTILTTLRLRLEPCRAEHLDGLQAINSDPQVMRYIRKAETREETATMIERVKARWVRFGTSWWSFVELASGEIIGCGCIQHMRRHLDAEPDPACPLEIGWRLRRDKWGKGFAREAALAMAAFAFDTLRVEELYAVCVPENVASSGLMQRLGMQYRGLEPWYDAELATYCIRAPAWRARIA